MSDVAYRREDVLAAFDELNSQLKEREIKLWKAYQEATDNMSKREYEEYEAECWTVLHAGLMGIRAERRVYERECNSRLDLIKKQESVA